MSYYRKKPVVIEAITFDELVQHGLRSTDNVVCGMPWSFEYNGHPISHETDTSYCIPTLEGTMLMTPEDVLITGVKGEIYPCKKDIFAATYDTLEGEVTADRGDENHDIGWAVRQMKNGHRVRRTGWNARDQWVYFVPPAEYAAQTDIAKQHFGDTVPYNAYFAIKGVDGRVSTWVPSSTDTFMQDWEVV